jgi:dienelactone hydrolase
MKLPSSTTFFLAAMSTFAADFLAPEKLPASTALPDPLTMGDGTRIETAEAWRDRRAPELRALFQHYMYGAQPETPPVSGQLLREDRSALGGKATLREVSVACGLGAPVHLLILLPNARNKPAACFLGINFAGNHATLDDPKIQLAQSWMPARYPGIVAHRATDAARGAQKEAWAIEQSIDRGYAVATFYHGDIVPDEPALAEAVLAKLRKGNPATRGPADTATIMAWAWGFSRMLDYLVTVPEIDAQRVAAVGHSRNGKTALVAAAFDERFALAIPSQAGCGGTAPSRVAAELSAPRAKGRPTVETVAQINRSFPHWFADQFKAFNAATDRLPFDQHCLIALCAPRPVLLSNATGDQWANPPGQFAMLRAADPVYRLVADDGLGEETTPEVGRLLASRLGYFIRPGKHSMTGEDWKAWLGYADRWLK